MKYPLAERPKCPTCGVYMELRPLYGQTPEQKYCGTWYNCPSPRCSCSVLLPSVELAQEYRKAGNQIKVYLRGNMESEQNLKNTR